MKKITFLVAFLLTFTMWQMNAQITQATGTFTSGTDFVDGDIYTDSGGTASTYGVNELSTLVLQALPGETLTVTFTAYATEASGTTSCWDTLTIEGVTYAGDDSDGGAGLSCTDATDASGNPTLGPFSSTSGGALTFVFDSDASINKDGWEATIGVSSITGNPPVINCPGSPVTADSEPGVCGAVVNYAIAILDVETPTVDLILTQVQGLASGEVFPVGTLSVARTCQV